MPSEYPNRVYRGGGWYYAPALARVAYRWDAPADRRGSLGVRLIREVLVLTRLAEVKCG